MVWVPAGPLQGCSMPQPQMPKSSWHRSSKANSIDPGTTIQMVIVAGDRTQASQYSSLWAESRFHRGPTGISVSPKLTGKNAW